MPNYHITSYVSGLRQRRLLGPVSGIQPIRPQTINGLKIWHAVRRETAYVNSDPISTLNDFSGNGNKATQTGTARPTYTTAGGPNSQPFALFDTSNDCMNFDSALTASNDYTLILVMANTAASVMTAVAGTSPNYFGVDGSNMYHNVSSNIASASTTITSGTFYILGMRRSGSATTHYKNGAAVGGGGSVTTTLSFGSYVTFTGGAINSPGMNFCECLIYDSCISTNDLNGLFSYLNGIYTIY